MNTNKKLLSLLTVMALTFSIPLYANSDHGQGGPVDPAQQANNCQLEPDSDSSLTQEVMSQLQFMGEEEKLARDVYVYLYNLWNQDIFTNIAKAEQVHSDSVSKFLDAYNIPNLAVDEYGIFTNPDLQNLYNSLIVKGSTSLIDALMVGALIEEVDIRDLIITIEQVNNQAMIQMYTDLLNGSYSHLRAFVSQLQLLGVTYSSQGYLNQQQVDDILSGINAHIAVNTAKEIDSSGLITNSESCIVNNIFKNSQLVGNNAQFNENDIIQITSNMRINSQDQGKNARLVAVADYTSNSGESFSVMRDKQSWVTWDGNINSLSYAESITLSSELNFNIFNSGLGGQKGQYTVRAAYVLDDASIIYSADSLRFSVQE